MFETSELLSAKGIYIAQQAYRALDDFKYLIEKYGKPPEYLGEPAKSMYPKIQRASQVLETYGTRRESFNLVDRL